MHRGVPQQGRLEEHQVRGDKSSRSKLAKAASKEKNAREKANPTGGSGNIGETEGNQKGGSIENWKLHGEKSESVVKERPKKQVK